MGDRSTRRMTEAEFRAEARSLFGDDSTQWRFVCPICGHVQSVATMVALGMAEDEARGCAHFSCAGRWMPKPRPAFGAGEVKPGDGKGCNYTLGGLFSFPALIVTTESGHEAKTFDFDRGGSHAERAELNAAHEAAKAEVGGG